MIIYYNMHLNYKVQIFKKIHQNAQAIFQLEIHKSFRFISNTRHFNTKIT